MTESDLQKIIAAVQKNPRYASIDASLVESVSRDMLQKGFSTKETIKHTRAKLHQVGGAYQDLKIPYDQLMAELEQLPEDFHSDAVKAFCREAMRYHRSTEERLNGLETLYNDIFSHLPAVESILDLACGFNPLTLPWIPVTSNCVYYACDIYPQMMDFLNAFFTHFNLPGEAFTCDLTQTIPQQEVDLALIFKTIPCLEQIDKSIGPRLLNQLHAKMVIVSFPVRSLSGRAKDMPRFYEEHFMEIVAQTDWEMSTFTTIDELFFMLK
ncbi:MAG: hypothetical protein V2J07_05140 [Anaerolineae bacterium]|jgi:16S rRNA (guanine(1405)-N(7))-methyltransferase|nr:hypothetical protein [Anaerolineae bacterium]